jgi:hypothetical protein
MFFRKGKTVQQFSNSIPSILENWYIKKARLKRRYPILTDRDLLFDEVKNGSIWDKLKSKLGTSKEELQKIISSR